MLTPDRLKNKTFTTSGKGSYRAEEVDSFMQEVSASYEQVFRENGEIIKKMSVLANKVEEYKKDEDSLRSALISAQKLADQIVKEAKENAAATLGEAQSKADELLDGAKAQADKLVSDAKLEADEKIHSANKEADEVLGSVNRKLTQEQLVYEMLQKEVTAFKNKIKDMYKEHLMLLDRLPEIVNKETLTEPEIPADEEVKDEKPETEDIFEEPAEAEAETETETVEDITEDVAEEDEENAFNFTVIDDDEEESAFDSDDDEADIAGDTDFLEDAEGFSIKPALFDDDGFEDISSGAADTDEFESTPASDDEDEGFVLNLDEIDLDDEDETPSLTIDSDISVNPGQYASADDGLPSDDEDDDEGAASFRNFFKKK